MPYAIARDKACPASKPFAVKKTDDGRLMGCHATEEAAQRQMAALYAKKMDEEIRRR